MTDILSGLMQETISGIALGCIYALIALGFTLIYKATEVVNFSQGEIMMVGAYMHFFFLNQYNNQIYRMNLLNIHLRSKTYKYIFFQVFRNNRYHLSLLNNISIFSYLQVHGKMKNVKLFISLNIYCILLSQG